VPPASETVSALSWMLHNFTELPPSLLQNLSCGRWQSPCFIIIHTRVGEKCDRTRPIINDDLGYCLKKKCVQRNFDQNPSWPHWQPKRWGVFYGDCGL
jgi:hypothetical protein